jgi:hypothetical protein
LGQLFCSDEDKKRGVGRRGRKGNIRYKARVVGGEVAEDLFNRGLCLPSGTATTEEDLDRVIDVIMRYGAGHKVQGAGRKKERGPRLNRLCV